MNTISSKYIKDKTNKLNDKALKSTEKLVTTSFEKIEKLQNKTDKFLKKGFNLAEKQQDNLFNSLENSKKMIWKNFLECYKKTEALLRFFYDFNCCCISSFSFTSTSLPDGSVMVQFPVTIRGPSPNI